MLWIDLAFATLVLVTLVNVLTCLLLAAASHARRDWLEPRRTKQASELRRGLR
jgi:hypothetical protein